MNKYLKLSKDIKNIVGKYNIKKNDVIRVISKWNIDYLKHLHHKMIVSFRYQEVIKDYYCDWRGPMRNIHNGKKMYCPKNIIIRNNHNRYVSEMKERRNRHPDKKELYDAKLTLAEIFNKKLLEDNKNKYELLITHCYEGIKTDKDNNIYVDMNQKNQQFCEKHYKELTKDKYGDVKFPYGANHLNKKSKRSKYDDLKLINIRKYHFKCIMDYIYYGYDTHLDHMMRDIYAYGIDNSKFR